MLLGFPVYIKTWSTISIDFKLEFCETRTVLLSLCRVTRVPMEAPVHRAHKFFFAAEIFRNLSMRKSALWAVCPGLLFSRICATKAIGVQAPSRFLLRGFPKNMAGQSSRSHRADDNPD